MKNTTRRGFPIQRSKHSSSPEYIPVARNTICQPLIVR